MKRVFIVEIDYNELDENIISSSPVLHEEGVEIAVEALMEGYKETNSIKEDFSVRVKEVFDV